MTIFISLLSSALLKYDPQTLADSSNIDILLTLLAALTIALPVIESILRNLRGAEIFSMAAMVSRKISLMLTPRGAATTTTTTKTKGAHKDVSNPASQDGHSAPVAVKV